MKLPGTEVRWEWQHSLLLTGCSSLVLGTILAFSWACYLAWDWLVS